MKMKTLLLVSALGLLAVVHSTPVDILAVTQSPATFEDGVITDGFLTIMSTPKKPEDEVIREVITDGFLVISSTIQSPQKNTAFQTSQPSSDSKESGLIEGNPEGDPNDKVTTPVLFIPTTTASAPHAQGSTPSMDMFDSSVESTTVTPSLANNVSTGDNSDLSDSGSGDGFIVETSSASSNATAALSIFTDTPTTDLSDSGSGDGFIVETSSASSTSTAAFSIFTDAPTTDMSGSGSGEGFITETSSALPTSTSALGMITDTTTTDRSGSGSGESSTEGTSSTELESFSVEAAATSSATKTNNVGVIPQPRLNLPLGTFSHEDGSIKTDEQDSQHKGHSTPGWIIILAFIVGVGALVMVCVAIATRDKWNAPQQASQLDIKTNSSNQQRGLEMETFLEKEKPRENGKAAEYTVIPLDELPDNYS